MGRRGLASRAGGDHIAAMASNDIPTPILNVSGIETWIFDLDNTLYHVTDEMHGEVDELLGAFVARFLGPVDTEKAGTRPGNG